MEYKNHLFLYILGINWGPSGAGLDSVWGPSGVRPGSVWGPSGVRLRFGRPIRWIIFLSPSKKFFLWGQKIFSLGSKKFFLSMEYKNHLFLYILGSTGAGLDSVWGPSGARLGSVWDFSSGWLAEIFVAPDQKKIFFQITTVFLPRGRFGFRLGLVWRRPDLSGTPRPSGWLKLSSPPVCFPSRYNIFLFPSQFLFWVYINYLLKY